MPKLVKLWKGCREQLNNVGGPNARATREAATTALSKYYLQSMAEGNHLDSVEDLERLSRAESRVTMPKPGGSLGVLYSAHGDKERSLKRLGRDVKYGLEILSDDNEDNTFSAVTRSLYGESDLVAEYLSFENEPSNTIGKRITYQVRSQVPDSRKQLERMQAAAGIVRYWNRLLREPDGQDGAELLACSYKHKWLEVPRVGADMYIGPKAKKVCIPTDVRPVQKQDSTGDGDRLLEIYFDEKSEEIARGLEGAADDCMEVLTRRDHQENAAGAFADSR
ncbi:hypothetical protein DL765_004052 [Monosporascus sp. GIB2]|nr:hypothetical protein DL765_004052 [Monosporascus sp. GIB2]